MSVGQYFFLPNPQPVTGADVNLSNLAGPTEINQDLLPDMDNAHNVGGGPGNTLNWKEFHGYSYWLTGHQFAHLGAGNSIQLNASVISDASNVKSIDVANRALYASDGSTQMFNWAIAGSLDAETNAIINVADPANPQDAATKNYVDSAVSASIPTALFFNGFMASTSAGWTTTSTTFALPSGGTNTLTTRNGAGLSVTAAASNHPGITFTPSSVNATYLITATFNSKVSAGKIYLKLSDGTTDIDSVSSSSLVEAPTKLSGAYGPGTASPVSVNIYAAVDNGIHTGTAPGAGATSLSNAIEWSVVQLSF